MKPMTMVSDRNLNCINVNDIIKKVSELPANLRFVNNNCLIDYFKERYKETQKYDSFFVKMNGERLEEIWGMYGKNLEVNKYVYRIRVPNRR
jgi:hypothetical protein